MTSNDVFIDIFCFFIHHQSVITILVGLKMNDIAVMTIRIKINTAEKLFGLLKDIGVKRDAYISQLLNEEVKSLAQHEPNSEKAELFIRFKESASNNNKVRFSIKLSRKLIKKINDVCAEKRVPRDVFVETFFDFLANGNGDTHSPLGKVQAILHDPYWESGKIDVYSRTCFVSDGTLEIMDELNRSFGKA